MGGGKSSEKRDIVMLPPSCFSLTEEEAIAPPHTSSSKIYNNLPTK
jgi:hypothetical protein